MSRHDDRDDSLDRLLKAAAPDLLVEPSVACLDAERLAAWTSGALSPAVADEVEAHLGECLRCQAMLATLVRSEPPMSAEVAVARRSRLAWILPMGLAAAAVIGWLVVYRPAPTPATPEQQMARLEPAPGALASSAASEPAPMADPATTTPASPHPTRSAAKTAPRGVGSSPLPAPVPVPAQQPPPLANGTTPGGAPTPAPPFAPAPARPTSSSVMHVQSEAPLIQAQSGERSFATPTEPTANLPIANRSFTALAELDPPAEFFSRSNTQNAAGTEGSNRPGGGGGAIAIGRLAGAASPNAKAVNQRVGWRVHGGLERSLDDGKSWEPIDVDPTAYLVSGDAPSADVCWVIGRQGAVLVATDGLHFTRIPFPEATDLRGVSATDNRHATVTTSDGRTFTTSDAGQHWQ